MTQQELDRLVADATGEEVGEIRHLGFSVADPCDTYFDPEPDELPPQVIDWDHRDSDACGPVAADVSMVEFECRF